MYYFVGRKYIIKKVLNFILNIKQWCYELNSIQIVSIILINCLLLTFVYGQSIAQVTQNIKATEQFKQIFTDFTLPYSYGKITSANYTGSDTVIINIQDLHLHPEAQKNIGNIISTFDKEFGLKNIYLEGAYGQVDTSWLANIKDKDKKEKTINSIFATGALTGAEYYSAMSNKPTLIKGLESREPYLNNLKRFGDILYAQNEITEVFNSMGGNARYLKSLYFNRKQNKIEELSKRYMDGDLEAKKYFVLLNKYANSLGIDLNKYENISLYIELLNLGRQIDYERSTKELQLLILKLKELLPYGAYKMILDSTSDFSDVDRLYTYLVRLSRKNSIDLSVNFPELNKFFSYIELSEKINPMDMLREEQGLKDELNIAFAYDDGEKEIAFLSGFMPYLKDYLTSKITSDDYNYYKNNIKKFKELWIKYIDNQKLKSLSKYEDTAETFYKINLDRNNYFMENIDVIKNVSKISKDFPQDLSETDKVIQSLKAAKNVSVIITGGFHTQGISSLLKKQGISYVVITPNVNGGVKLAEDIYYALAKEQSRILFQALSTLNLTQVPENMKPLMLTEVLIQKGYTIEAMNEALKNILVQGETAQLTGSLDNLDGIELTVSKNGQATTYSYKGSEFKIKSADTSQTQEETQSQGNQKSRNSIWTAVRSFIGISSISLGVVVGASVAIGLAVVTGFLWFLAPLIFFGLLFIANMFFIGYELYQDSFLAKEDSSPSDIPESMTAVYMFKKLLRSLPQNLAKEFASAVLRVPLDSIDALLYGYDSNLAQRIEELNLTETGAVMETGHAGIKLNYSMIRSKFFDESGKNIINQRMLEVFVKHELRHESFRTSTGFFGRFIHSKPWLEESIVSAEDLLTAINNFFGNLFRSVPKPLTEINLNSYSNIEQSLTTLLGRDSREISQRLQIFCMLNPNINLTEDILKNLGFNSQEAEVLAGIKFKLNLNTQNLSFEDILSFSQPQELVKQLINTENPDAVVMARAIELLGYNSIDTFEEFKNIARSVIGNTSAERFKELKEILIQKVNNNVVTEIKNGQTLSKAFSKGFLTAQLISIQNMLAFQDVNENDIRAIASAQAISSFQDLFENLVKQKIVEKLYVSIENTLPQEFKTQQTKDALFNNLIDNLSFNLGNLTKALVNTKESLLRQIIDKKQDELDLLSVSLAQKGQNIVIADKASLEIVDKNTNSALMQYSFNIVDQSQYNQQTAEFVNIIKRIYLTENSWEQLKNKETRDKLVGFLKQYYDARIIESNISFLESITDKKEALRALSSLIASLVRNRRIYNDVNFQRALADLFPLTIIQYSQNEMLNGESLILQASIDQEGFISDIKTYMLILSEFNSFSTENTPEKQRAQFLIENCGKYALSVLDYPINNGAVAFKSGSRLKALRTELFNILRGISVDVSNIEYPQDRLFAQQQPQLSQAEQIELFAQLPREIENLEKQTRKTKNDKQALKNLNNSQNKLDDAIFAGQNVSASAKRMVNAIRNIMQAIIDKGDFDLDELEQLKDLVQQCRTNILANNSDPDLDVDMYNAMVIAPLDVLIMQKSANSIDVKNGLSTLSAVIDVLLRLQSNFKATNFESFLRNENDTTINFALKEGEISNLYVALAFSRFATVLNDLCAVHQTLTTDLETSVTSRQETAIILERLRYWLPAGSAAKEFARLDLVNIFNDIIAKFQEVLTVGEGHSDRITETNLNTLKSLQLAQSNYNQTFGTTEAPATTQETPTVVTEEIPEETKTEGQIQQTTQETKEETQPQEDVTQITTQEQTPTITREVTQEQAPATTVEGAHVTTTETKQDETKPTQEAPKKAKSQVAKPIEDQTEKIRILVYSGMANVNFARMLGITGTDTEITNMLEEAQKTSFVEPPPKASEIFKKEGVSKKDLITELLKTNYHHAVIAALALKNLDLSEEEFQNFYDKATKASSDRTKFYTFKDLLTKEIEARLVARISQGEAVNSALAYPFPSDNILQLKNMLSLKIVNEQDVKNLARSFKGEQFFDELRNIVGQKVIASEQVKMIGVLSQESIEAANSLIQLYIPELYANENPIDAAKNMYGVMIVSNIYDNISSGKYQLTKEELRNILNDYFPNLIITKETADSFFEGDVNQQETARRVMDYLLNNLSHMTTINKIAFLQNRIHLNQKAILLADNKEELSKRAYVLNAYETILRNSYKDITGNTANTLNDMLAKTSGKEDFKLSMLAVDIFMTRDDISKVTGAKDDYNSLNTKLQSIENLLRYLIDLQKFPDLSEEQLDEVNQKIRVLSNESISLRAQIVVASSNGEQEIKKLFSTTEGPIQNFIKALSIRDSLGIDATNPVYIAIENFNKNPTPDNLRAMVGSFKTIISQNNQSKFKEIIDNMPYNKVSVELIIDMLSFVANDVVDNANGDIAKLKLAVLINTMFSNYGSVGSNIYIGTIYSLIESLNTLINTLDETDSNRSALERKLQELFVIGFSVSSINIADLNTSTTDPKRYLSMLEKEKKILQSFKGKAVVSDDEILKIVRRKEMLMKNFMRPMANFTSKTIQEQTYKFNIYKALISSYDEFIANMSSPELLAKLSLQNEFKDTDANKDKIRKIVSKLNAFQEISDQEVAYLESIKNTNLYPKAELISAIKLNLQVDAQMPFDFVSKVLSKADLNELFTEFSNSKNQLIKNRPEFGLEDHSDEDFKDGIAILDKILANICSSSEINSVFGNNAKYFFVTKYSHDKNTLMQIVQREDISIQYRLYAYGYLKAMDVNNLDDYVQTQGFLDKVKEKLEAKDLQIGSNYFDLRACEIGINIVTSNEVLNELISADATKTAAFKSFTLITYRDIMKSNFVLIAFGNENAHEGLSFTFARNKKEGGLDVHDRMYTRIAHELGHRQLLALGIFSTKTAKSSGMFHEFFADIVAGMYMSKFLGRTVEQIMAKNSSINRSYVVFSMYRMAESAADEQHKAARGLINSIKKACDLAGKIMNFETILALSIRIAGQVQVEGLFVAQQEENLAKKIVTEVALATTNITTKEEEKGEFLYQFIKEEGVKFNTLQEEQEIFGSDEQGQKNLYYYLVAKHGHETRPKFFGKDLYDLEKQFIENYRDGHIASTTNFSNVPTRVQQVEHPTLMPSYANPLTENQVLSENEAKKATESTTRHSVIWWIGMVLAHITVIPAIVYWLYRFFSSKQTGITDKESSQKEIDGSVDSIVEILNASLSNIRIQDDRIFDDFIEELEQNLNFVKNRYAGDSQKARQAGELFRADIENLFNLIANLKANKSFTQGQKLTIARVIVRSWALAVANDAIRMAKVADPEDVRTVSDSMLQNGVTDKAVLDALNNFFAGTSNLTPSQIIDLAYHANDVVVDPQEYRNFGIAEYEETFSQEENRSRFDQNDILEIAKQIQLLHLMQPKLEISADILRQIGVMEGLDTILAQAMSKVKFSKTNVKSPRFSSVFSMQATENMPELLSSLANSNYPRAVIIANAIDVLGLNTQNLQEIVNSIQASRNDSKMFFELQKKLLSEIDNRVSERLSNKEDLDRVLNWALPTNNVMALMKLRESGVIDNTNVSQIASSLQKDSDLVEELVYQKVVQSEYGKLATNFPKNLSNETVKREIAKRIATYLRSGVALDDLSVIANIEFATVITEQLISDIANNVDNTEKLQQLDYVYGLLSKVLSKDEIDNITKDNSPGVGAALVANNLTKLASRNAWVLRVATSLARFSVASIDVSNKNALNLRANARNILTTALNELVNTGGLLDSEYQNITNQLLMLYQEEITLRNEILASTTSKEELNKQFNSLNTLEQNIRKSFFSETRSLAEEVDELSKFNDTEDLQKAFIITNLLIVKNEANNGKDARDSLESVQNREKEMGILARALENLLKSQTLSEAQKQDIKQKLVVVQQEQINLINAQLVINTQKLSIVEIDKGQTKFKNLMRNIVVNSMDDPIFNITKVQDLSVLSELNDFVIDQDNLLDTTKIQELRNDLFEFIDKTNPEQVNEFNGYFNEINSISDLSKKKVVLEMIVASIAVNLANTANGDIEKLKFAATLSKMAITITNTNEAQDSYTSQVIVDLANTLKKLVNVLPRDSIEQNNVKKVLATIVQQEFTVTYGLSKLYSLISDDTAKQSSKILLESSNSLEKILTGLNISDKAQAIRYIRQRNMILKNVPNYYSHRDASIELYKKTNSNLDKLIAYTATPVLLQEQFPQDAEYFNVIRISSDDKALLDIIQDTNRELRYRLYAFAQLKSRGINEVNGINVDNYIQTLIPDIQQMLQAKALSISRSYFDLRAVIIAINIVASSETIKVVEQAGISTDNIKADEQNQYSNILQANFLQRLKGQSFNADSGMNFMRFEAGDGYSSEYECFYETIAHELGHTYLVALGFKSGVLNVSGEYIKTQDRVMVHELTADLVSSVFNSFLLQTNVLNGGLINGIRKIFNVFTSEFGILKGQKGGIKKERNITVQEAHSAARGLLNAVRTTLEKMSIAVNSDAIFRPLLGAAITVAMTVSPTLFGEGQQNIIAKEIVLSIASNIAESNPDFDKGEFLYQFIQNEGVSFNNFEEEKKIFGNDAKGQEALARYIVAKHSKPRGSFAKMGFLYTAEEWFLKNYQNEKPDFSSTVSNINIIAQPLVPVTMQESIASARFTSIRAGILAFFNTGGFVAMIVLLCLGIITGIGVVVAASIGASVLAVIGVMSIMSSIYESNQKRVIKELEGSGEVLPAQESRLVFAELVRSLPQETAIKLVQATFNDANLANEYLNSVSGINWQNDVETNDAIVNALNGAITNDNTVVMETTDTGKILFSPYIVKSLLNNPIMLRVTTEHELHHLKYAKATGGLLGFIHKTFPGLEEFIVSFSNVFRWFGTKLQDKWRAFGGNVPVVWNLPEGLVLGDVLINKVNKQGVIEAPNIQIGRVQLANGKRGTLSYKVARNGFEVPNFEFGKTKFDAEDIGNVEITYTFMPDTYTLSFATNDANATPMQQTIKSGEAVHLDSVVSLPQRTGYKFNGYKYVNAEGKVRTISNQEITDSFDIPGKDITGDLKLQALWIAESSDVAFVDENGTIIRNVAGAAISGQNVRIAGLGRFGGLRRFGNAIIGNRTGVKTQKITWNLPSEISVPEGLPEQIYNDEVLNAPLIAEGRVQLKDGRFGTLRRIVKMDGEIVENFQFGTTPIKGELNIEYTFTPERYNINFVANGADSNVPAVINNVLSDGQTCHVNGLSTEQLPTKAGYLFKGYSYTTKDGRTVNVNRMDVVNGFDIDATDVTGDIDFVAQWEQREKGEQYEVEFSNASLSSVAGNLNNKSAIFGQPYIIDHNLIRKNVTDLTADNWNVTGYVVSVNGVDIMKVDINDINNISDVTVPAQDVVGKLTIRFLRNPKVTFDNEFAQDEIDRKKLETMEIGYQFTFEQLGAKARAEYDARGTVGHWSRSDGKDLTAPITEPITFTYSERFYNVADKNGKWPANVFVLLLKGIFTLTAKIYHTIVTLDINKISVIKNAFKGLNVADVVKIVFSVAIMVGMIALLVFVSAPGLFGLLIIGALIVAIINIVVVLFGPIAKEILKTLRDKAETDKEIERYNYYLEVLDLILNTVNSKTSSSKVFPRVRMAMYIAVTAIFTLGVLVSSGVLVIAASWAVPLAIAVFGLLVIGLAIFMIVKYKTNPIFKSIMDILWKFFKNSNWKFKVNVIVGMLVSIGALAAFFIVPLAAGLSLLILLSAIAMFVTVIALFFIYNTNEFYQTTRDVLLENLAGEGKPNAAKIRSIIANYEEGNYGAIAEDSFMLLVNIIGVRQLLISAAKGTLNGISMAVRGLVRAIMIGNPLGRKFAFMAAKGVFIFGKQWASEAIYNTSQRIQNVVVTYATNVYDSMTNITSSLDAVPVREGFEFDGYEVTSENSDITTIISAEQANTDFAVPADMVNGKVTVKVRWKPNILINTGDGTRSKLGFSTKNSFAADATNGIIKLGEYAGTLTPPEGYDYGSLYWTSDLFPDKTFSSNEMVKVDRPGSFTPHWKPFPQVKIAIGQGSWKNRSQGDASTQREASVSANALGGVNVDLRKLSKELQAPQDCDPNSLYWISEVDPSIPIVNGVVTATQNTTYIPCWKKLSEVGKARIQTGDGPNDFIIGTRTKNGTIDLTNISRKLKAPNGYKDGTLYWNSDAYPGRTFRGIINANDAKNISVLIPHWEEDPLYQDNYNIFSKEEYADMDAAFSSHPVKFFAGVTEGEIDNVKNLPESFKDGFSQGNGGYTFPGFTNSWFDMGKYWVPQRMGYRFNGVKVIARDRKGEVLKSWIFEANPDSTMDAFNIEGTYAIGDLEISMMWISEQELARQQEEAKDRVKQENARKEQELQKSLEEAKARREESQRMQREAIEKTEQEKTAQEKALAEQKEAEEKAAQERLLAQLKTEEERVAKEKELAEQKRIKQEQAEQAKILAQQKAVQEKTLAEQKAERESVGREVPLQMDMGILKVVGDGLTSKDFPIKFGQDFHFPGLVERGYWNWMGVLGSRKWLPQVEGFNFNGFKITIGNKTRIISREEAMNGFDIKKEDLQYKNIGSEGLIKISLMWQRKEPKQKSQETASETSIQAAQIASVLAADAAKMTMPDKLAQVPLMAMSKLMANISEFENYQTEQIKIAQKSVISLNYYMGIDDSSVLNEIARCLPFGIREAFSQNVSVIEDNTPGVVMSFNPNDGKIHVNYRMLRAMFFDAEGNIKNQDLLEVFVKHELRHKDYSSNQSQFYKMVHSIDVLEEFIVSMGDIYDWSKLHPELTNLQLNYEDTIRFVMTNPALVVIAAKVGRQEAFNIAQTQSRLYYREIEDQVINLVVPTYAQEPTMFNNVDMKKSPRLIVVNSQIGVGSAELGQVQVFKDGGYSTALIEHMPQGASVESYRMPVNATFSVNRQEMAYDIYIREVNGVHVIGLKLKENISKELDTAENYAKAVLTFTKNVNNNSVLRREFNTLKEKASQVYGISSNLEINSNGISMVDFSGLNSNGETIDVNKMFEETTQQEQGQLSVTEGINQEDLKGVYIANDLEISQGTLQTIDQDIKAEEIFKLDEPEKFYQISVSAGKLDSKFIERAVHVKMEQGATAIILDVTGDIDIANKQVTDRLLTALTAIHSLGLKVIMKVDMNKAYASKGEMFRKLFELGFDGINMDGQQETDVAKLKEVLDLLKAASQKYAVGARNAIQLKDEEVKEALKNSLGQTGFEGYNTLVVTEINNTTGEMKVEASKMQRALNKGYDRARKLGEMQIQVNASKLGAMNGLLTAKAEMVTAGQVREAVNQAGLNPEVVKHIDKLLKGTTVQEKSTARVLEALGFARGLLEASLVTRYMSAFDFTQETYQINSVTDRQALGVVLTKAYLMSPEKFASKETLQQYFKEAENTMIQESQSATFEQQRAVMASYVNSVVSQIESEGLVESKETEKKQIDISLAVLNDSINKISFNRIVEDAKRRTKTSTNAVKSILGAA